MTNKKQNYLKSWQVDLEEYICQGESGKTE